MGSMKNGMKGCFIYEKTKMMTFVKVLKKCLKIIFATFGQMINRILN